MEKNERFEYIGSKIREAREDAELSQSELAEELGYSSPTAISLIESGSRRVAIDDLERVAEILERPLDFFLGSETNRVDVQQALRADKSLNSSDVKQISEYIKFVRSKKPGKRK